MLNAKLKPIETNEERSARRYRLLLQASAEAGGSGLVDVIVHDLSATGFLIECTSALGARAEVTLELPGAGTATGDVIWASGNFFGGEFRTPLDRKALDTARSASPVVWPEFTSTSASDRTTDSVTMAPGADQEIVPDDRLPLAHRAQIIVGASLLLWVPIAFGVWTLLA